MDERTLTFRNGHRVTLVAEGTDEHGPYLRLRHLLPTPGRQAGPHWHPTLAERWTVRRGALRFRIDGTEVIARQGDSAVAPAGVVHESRNEAPTPRSTTRSARHCTTGPCSNSGTHSTPPERPPWPAASPRPTGPRPAVGLPGRLSRGIPPRLQRTVLGGLARLARALGYERRWLRTSAAATQ